MHVEREYYGMVQLKTIKKNTITKTKANDNGQMLLHLHIMEIVQKLRTGRTFI